eukprot:9919-Eustigmatos_ZCMA.PRE.1
MASLVLPPPVGAQRSRFSGEYSAALHILLCTRLSVVMPSNAECVHFGSSEISIRRSSSDGTCFTAG